MERFVTCLQLRPLCRNLCCSLFQWYYDTAVSIEICDTFYSKNEKRSIKNRRGMNSKKKVGLHSELLYQATP